MTGEGIVNHFHAVLLKILSRKFQAALSKRYSLQLDWLSKLTPNVGLALKLR